VKKKIDSIFGDRKMIADVVSAIKQSLDGKEYLKHLHGLPKEVAPIIKDRMFYTKLMGIVEAI
jgi:hypothetical protein